MRAPSSVKVAPELMWSSAQQRVCVILEIILRDLLADILRGLLQSLTHGYRKNPERELRPGIRFQASFEPQTRKFSGLGDIEMLRQLGNHFRIHPLALENVLSAG